MTKLKQIRIASGMTQTRLAEVSGVSLGVLKAYEQGRKPINGAAALTVHRIALALGCTVEDLIDLNAQHSK